jgi:hypothetical protein
LTPDAYFDAPTRIRKLANKRKKQPAVVLIVPAPSGMNCAVDPADPAHRFVVDWGDTAPE